MNKNAQNIDQHFAQASQDAKVDIPDHLGDAIFSKLSAQGLSSTATTEAASIVSTTATKSIALKTVIYACIATAVTGFILGWTISYKYYQKNPKIEKQPIIINDLKAPKEPDTNDAPVTTPVITSEDPTETTKTETKPANSGKKNITSKKDLPNTNEQVKINYEVTPVLSNPSEETKSPVSTNDLTPVAKKDSIEVSDREPQETPIEKNQPEKKSLLDQLKEKEDRFNGNLFEETK